MHRKADINIKNKKAWFEYEVLDRYTAGLQLFGTEIKSIRESKASLADTYCQFYENELWVKGMHIAEYSLGTCNNHIPKRDRKLLLTRRELRKLQNRMKERGNAIIPVMLYVDSRGYAKLLISLAKGKKFYDKRDSIKEKDSRRDMERQMR